MWSEEAERVRTPLVIRGTGVGKGIAIGPLELESPGGALSRREILRRLSALGRVEKRAVEELAALRERAEKSVGEEHGEIFVIYEEIITSGELSSAVKEGIEQGKAIASAISDARDRLISLLDSDKQGRARASHLKEVARLMISFADEEGGADDPVGDDGEWQSSRWEKYILVAYDGESGFLSNQRIRDRVIGIVSVGGSENSGLAAYARAKGLPALVISEKDAPSASLRGAGAIIDSERGRLTVNPDLGDLDRFAESTRAAEENEKQLSSLIGLPAVTRSGRHVSLSASVKEEEDIATALSFDAEGIGLLSADDSFLSEDAEELQRVLFSRALEAFKGKGVTVKLYGGGDGKSDVGPRGLRFCLSRKEFFKRQLRALLRAAAGGELSAVIPLAVSADEVRHVRALINETAGELKSREIDCGELFRLGVMIDTPAAAVNSASLASEADFFVADTDMLSQLTLGVDRRDPSAADVVRRNPDPILRLVATAVSAVHRSEISKKIIVAGDMTGDVSLTESLLATGADGLCSAAPYILSIKKRIRESP